MVLHYVYRPEVFGLDRGGHGGSVWSGTRQRPGSVFPGRPRSEYCTGLPRPVDQEPRGWTTWSGTWSRFRGRELRVPNRYQPPMKEVWCRGSSGCDPFRPRGREVGVEGPDNLGFLVVWVLGGSSRSPSFTDYHGPLPPTD